MNKLESELQRLYLLPGENCSSQASATSKPVMNLITTTGLVRCLVISLENTCDWAQIAALYQGVQEDLDLPAPAIAVSVEEGYQIWFSLAEPIALQAAQDFLQALCRKYLAETKAAKITLRPSGDGELSIVPLVPAKRENPERWSAYIDPTMGSMFTEESWLEMAPSLDRQAGILAALENIKTEDFQRASGLLQSPPAENTKPPTDQPSPQNSGLGNLQAHGTASMPTIGSDFTNPWQFLLAVMNEPSLSAEHRIQAAIALLPYFGKDAEQ